jgi:WD40 repeat protein
MHQSITRMVVAVAAGAALSTVGLSEAGASGEASHAAAPGAQLWVERYNGPGNGFDGARSTAVSPDGKTVFVTGGSAGASSGEDYATIAYSATGARRWVKRYNGPGNSGDFARAVTISPDGKMVFVTGYSTGASSAEDYATIAYNAATGKFLWLQRYNGPGNGGDFGRSVAVSPDGRTVFVTGGSEGVTSGSDWATIAYNTATGAKRWVKRYNGPANFTDNANALAVSPTGGTVFVTGDSFVAHQGFNYATVAYNAATGAKRWVKRYTGSGLRSTALSVAVSPNGNRVFVTGASMGATDFDYATIGYTAATGARLWVKRYNGPGNGFDAAQQVAVSPDGAKVFITGESTGTTSGPDYATIGYTAATGARLWVKRYNGPGDSTDGAISLTVNPDGSRVFVTGESIGATSHEDYATIAYSG